MAILKRIRLLWRIRKPPTSRHPPDYLLKAIEYYLDNCPNPSFLELAEQLRYSKKELEELVGYRMYCRFPVVSLRKSGENPFTRCATLFSIPENLFGDCRPYNPHRATLAQVGYVI